MSWQERITRQWSTAGFVRIPRKYDLAKRTGRIWSVRNAECKLSSGINVPKNCWLKELDWRQTMGKAEFLKKAGLKQPVQRNTPTFHRQADADSHEGAPQPDPCPRCGADVGWHSLPARRSLLAPLLRNGYYRRCPMCKKETEVQL